MANYYLITATAPSPLPIREKQAYVQSLYLTGCTYQKEKKRNQGFLHKFASSLGFKPVLDYLDNESRYFRPSVESPEEYKTPQEMLFEGLNTPVNSVAVMEFYLPFRKMSHPDPRFSYNTKVLAEKFHFFLQKVFPDLLIVLKIVDNAPKVSSRDYVLQSFYRSLNDSVVTIEDSIPALLAKEDLEYILTRLQPLSKEPVGIAQFPCNVCEHNTFGKEPYHIEIVYLERNGKQDPIGKRSDYGYGEELYTLPAI